MYVETYHGSGGAWDVVEEHEHDHEYEAKMERHCYHDYGKWISKLVPIYKGDYAVTEFGSNHGF